MTWDCCFHRDGEGGQVAKELKVTKEERDVTALKARKECTVLKDVQ